MYYRLEKLVHVSVWKTLRFNIHYFGISYAFRPIAILTRNVSLKSLRGGVSIDGPKKFAMIKIGFNGLKIIIVEEQFGMFPDM